MHVSCIGASHPGPYLLASIELSLFSGIQNSGKIEDQQQKTQNKENHSSPVFNSLDLETAD